RLDVEDAPLGQVSHHLAQLGVSDSPVVRVQGGGAVDLPRRLPFHLPRYGVEYGLAGVGARAVACSIASGIPIAALRDLGVYGNFGAVFHSERGVERALLRCQRLGREETDGAGDGRPGKDDVE